MNNLICQLIETKSRVIIPGFGAFVCSRDGDSTAISFNQYLNFDDGLLVNFVAEQRGSDNAAARQDIANYVADLNARLDRGETVVIGGIGSLHKDGSRIDFNENNNMTSEPETTNTSLEFVDNEPKTEPVPSFTNPQPQEPQPEQPQEPQPTYVYEEKRSVPTWIWIVVIAVVFLVAVYLCLFVFNKDNAVYEFFFPPKEEVVVEPTPAPAPDTTAVVEPEPVVEVPASKLGRNFYIVVGTYNDNAGAQHRVSQLIEKGFDKAFTATYDGKYVAVIEQFTSLVEAEAKQEQIVDNYRIESYIVNGGQ